MKYDSSAGCNGRAFLSDFSRVWHITGVDAFVVVIEMWHYMICWLGNSGVLWKANNVRRDYGDIMIITFNEVIKMRDNN